MDVAANLAVAGVCTAALIQWGAPRSAYSILVPLFLLCLVGTKVARIVLRPYYSRLRHLPGPTVRLQCIWPENVRTLMNR